jgi:hypothetical protein
MKTNLSQCHEKSKSTRGLSFRLLLAVSCVVVLAACPGPAPSDKGGAGGGSTGGPLGGSGGGSPAPAAQGDGGISGGTGGSAGGGSLDEACSDYAAKFCAKLNQCSPAYLIYDYGTEEVCRSRAKISCVSEANAPNTSVTATQFKACAAAKSAQSCSDFMTDERPDACIYKGSRIDGQACGENSQCQSGLCRTNGNLCGVCGKAVGIGEKCQGQDDCEEGLRCDGTQCKKRVENGQACRYEQDCKVDSYCFNGTCVASKTMGGTDCNDSTYASCNINQKLYCEVDGAKVCKLITFLPAGSSCRFPETCASGRCKITRSGEKGTCTAFAADGAMCDPKEDIYCQSPASCVNGYCKLPNPGQCN